MSMENEPAVIYETLTSWQPWPVMLQNANELVQDTLSGHELSCIATGLLLLLLLLHRHHITTGVHISCTWPQTCAVNNQQRPGVLPSDALRSLVPVVFHTFTFWTSSYFARLTAGADVSRQKRRREAGSQKKKPRTHIISDSSPQLQR
ncbi:hypothetical protein JOB18_034532 [Solea senegalensis]|uniref:Uncharacterized protein n=1 Tax=Solea senegalensis TaxID=28829 RepID=A0AAV6RJ09_SOLSE|nr:hypothetical protein JOB18_034532 [Solea senegalensis]